MNILFMNSIGRKKFGGGEKWMIMAARGLAEAGHRTRIAGKTGSRLLEQARTAGVETHQFDIHSEFNPLLTWRIMRYLQQNRIHVLVCNLNKDVRVAGLAARLARHPVVIARHGMLLCSRKWKHKMTLTRLTDGILTNSHTIRQAYEDYGWFVPEFVNVIYNGVEDGSDSEAHEFAHDYPERKIILSAGRLSHQKGFDVLIRAAALLRQKRHDLAFVIAGKGKEKKKLQQLARNLEVSDQVFFCGHQDDVSPYLKGCDLFVLASRFEGMPNVVMEAMANATPVIATNVNGVSELMVHHKTGLIVPPENPKQLADAIHYLIDETALLRKFGVAGQERVQALFTIPRMVANLEAYFAEMIDRRRQKLQDRGQDNLQQPNRRRSPKSTGISHNSNGVS